ncbi:DUF3857 domain-containing protein, partial [bacterium]|nr:DUF3857 domain-containing protein [bacterium]
RYYSMTSRSDDAVRLYTSLLESRGLGAADLTEFGTCHARENAPSQAVALYRTALARDPMANATRVAIAQHYLERDLVDLAQPLVEQAIAVYSNDVSARLTMVDVFNARNWDEDAYRLAQDTAERFPDSDDVQGTLAGAADNKDYEEIAEQAWKRAIACNHWYGHARSRLATLFMRQRRLGDFNAELAIQRALWPASPASHLPLLRAALSVRDLPRSRALCLDALTIFPDHAALHRYLGDIEYMEGHKERAIEAYEATLRYDPGDLWLRRYLDYLHERNMAFFDTYGWSQERVAGRIAATAGIEPASDEEIAHTLLRQTLIQMHQDGSSRRMHHVVVRVMRARGVQALSSVSMDASQVLRAVTYKGDGRVLEATHASERQIEFADVQVGDVIEYKYLVDRYGGGWMDENFYYIHAFDQAQNNVEIGELAIALPTNRALLASLSHDDILRAVRPFDGNIVHRWWMTNIPPFRSEPNDPPFIDLARVVTASTVTNWEQVASWQRGMLSGVIRGDQNLGPLARTITAGATSDAQRADLVFRYITKNFRYTQMYETPIAGIKPHPIPDILANRCGDCKDLSLLAAELLKAAGIEARMALLRTANRGRIIRAVPAYDFNHAIVYIPGMGRRGMFMDPTFRLGAFDLLPRLCQDVDTLVLTGTGYEFVRTPLAPAADNHSDGLLEGAVDESGGCTGVYTLSLMRGDAADGRGLLEGMDDRARIGQFIVGRVEPGARMTSFDVLNTEPGPEPLVLKAGFATDRFARPGAEGLALSLPMPLEPEKLLGGLEARSHPLRFDSTDMSVQRYRLVLPDGYTAGVPEPDVRMNDANALFTYAAAVSNGVLDVEWKLIIRTRDIRAAEYPGFRDFMARAAYVTSQVITLRPAGR